MVNDKTEKAGNYHFVSLSDNYGILTNNDLDYIAEDWDDFDKWFRPVEGNYDNTK